MNGLARIVQRPRLGPVFVLSAAASLVTGVTTHAVAQGTSDPNPTALVAARELFREATADVDAGRFDVALGKFRRVAEVKETPAVRFNIARCEEQLVKLGAALNDYETAAREGASDAKSADVAKLARDKAGELRPRVPRLTITAPTRVPPDLVVKLDGQKQPNATLGVPLPVDPGRHTIEATGQDASFKKDVELRETEAVTVGIDLGPPKGGPPEPGTALGEKPGKPETLAPETNGGPNRVPGYVTLGVGGALGIASLAFLIVHNSKASDLGTQKTQICTLPHGACPLTSANALNSLQNDARTFEGLAIGFGIATAVAIGMGTVLVLAPPGGGKTDKTPSSASALVVPTLGGAAVLGFF